ncbi:Metallo peptidase M43B, zinc-dependent metalloprotease, pappalysin-like protein [Mycena indigotica]|uniref:Metallo peptidase M43B, zinc-dependent metalloprotease, pappalysin-like protein n=1 Tax=Mycena indigotica TaxID=2126181 RepID=A0A8H6SWF9_9AGAR|nr:Metallo peptidase M43B, zinc-dependent metalloprotease, pappalysin-like protein [Mycena indigotica]KAF7307490.1 Metallo peptidase M43B, zinc-dependent metalloprotease, pappalysin-like protein [Mycena indigotica]
MIALKAVVLALSAVSALGHQLASRQPKRGCATEISAAQKDAVEADFAARRTGLPAKKAAPVTIPTYFHIIRAEETVDRGDIPESQVIAQMDALNAAFVNTPYTFELKETTRTTNETWFDVASPWGDDAVYQDDMKATLRRGGRESLNLYSLGFTDVSDGLLGYSTFASSYESNPQDDGVVFLYSTVPGGSRAIYNLGGTVSHEVGHWVGLYHTFNEGDGGEEWDTCDVSTDLVDDTPAQLYPTNGCPERSDTCPDVPGDDAIHNYMDYSDDVCYNNFTPGQVERMIAQMAIYRGL